MSTEPQKFRKKPVEIEAMQFTGPAESATPIIDWSDNLVARLRAYREHGVGGLAAQAMVEAADRIEALESMGADEFTDDDLAQVIFDSDAKVSWFDSILIARAVMPLIEVERRAARELSMALAEARNDAASAEAAKDEWVLRFHAADAELARIHAVMAEVDSEVDPLDEELADMHAEAADLRAERDAEAALADEAEQWMTHKGSCRSARYPLPCDCGLAAWRARRGQGGGE